MSGRDRDLLVVASTASPGVCKFCRRRIVWVTVAREGRGRPARTLPFDASVQAVSAHETVEDGERRLSFQRWPAAQLHTRTCAERPQADPTRRHLVDAARRGQGRMW